MNLPAYPKYKPSGVEWLGDVPEHWHSHRVKWAVSGCINGVWGDDPDGVDDVICVRVADFDRDNLVVVPDPPTMRAIEPRQLRYRQLQRDDLLIEKSGGGEQQLVGRVVSFNHDYRAVCSNFVARMVVTGEAPSRFWCYVHAAMYSGRLNYPAIKQTTGIQNLDAEAYLDTPAPFPPISEQKAIAAFLDRESARIDRLVAKKRELIERLKEKRTALIFRTVTRGLPPAAARAAGLPENPSLKPSCIEWLGDIPSHWDVSKITHGFALIGSGTTPKSDSEEFYDGDVAWVTTSELRESVILSTKERVTLTALAAHPTLRIYPAGTLLFAMYGATIGRLGILGIPATVNQACCAFAQPTRFVTRYVFYWLWMRRPILVSLSSGGGQPNLSQDDLRQVRLTVPPKDEQLAIAEYLDVETARIDALLAKVETAVERLQEYRTALITAAVTGKIDVRREVSA